MEIPLWGDIVIIFEQDEQNFDTIGLGMLVPNSGVVYEEFNGDFTLTFQHPYDASGKWTRIEIDRIVLAETPRGRQPFRIYYYKPTMNGIEVQARHLFYDLLDNICESVAYSGSAQGAMDAIKEGLSVPMPFTFYTDISCDTGGIGCTMDNPVSLLLKEEWDNNEGETKSFFYFYGGELKRDFFNVSMLESLGSTMDNPVSLLLKEEWDNNEGETKSFFYFYGGELKRDFFNVSMLESLGSDRGVFIVYRKNLVGLEVTEDISDVATRIYPIGKDGLALDGQYIDSQYVNNYAYPKVKVIEDTKAESQSDLREIAENFFAEGGDIPKVNIKVDFIDLSQTEEYKNYANLEKVFLGDTVTVVNQKMGFSKKAKIISYEFDVILGRYNKIELGDFSPTVTSPITRGANAGDIANTAYGKSNNAETLLQQHLKDFNNPHRVTAEQVGSGGTGGGSTVLNGTEAPSDALGNDGDYYIKDEVQGIADEHTLLLLHGEDFTDSSIYSEQGTEAPSDALGNDGDYYIKDEVQGIADEHTLLLLHGEDFTDSSIYSEQITNTGCTLSDSGKFGKAISFTNLNKLETVEQIFDINGEFTIDFWFSQREKKANATFIGGTQTGTFKIILSNGLETVEQIFDINGEFTIDFWFSQREKKANATFIGGTQTGTFKIILSNGIPVFQVHGQTSYYSSFVDTQLNTWYHFALTGKNKTYSMFVDGVKKNTFTYTGNISNDILRIGLNVAQNSTGSIEGVMDEIRISNVVRWDSKKNTFTYTGNISNDILRIGLNVAQNSTGSIEGVMDEIRISNVVRWDSDFTPPTEPYTVYKNAQAGEIYVKESGTWKKILTGMK